MSVDSGSDIHTAAPNVMRHNPLEASGNGKMSAVDIQGGDLGCEGLREINVVVFDNAGILVNVSSRAVVSKTKQFVWSAGRLDRGELFHTSTAKTATCRTEPPARKIL